MIERDSRSSFLNLQDGFEFFDERGESFFVVADDAEVGFLEDVSFGIAVDGDDTFGARAAGEMLGSAGYADGDVEAGTHHVAGLADFKFFGHPAFIAGNAAGSDGSSEDLSQVLKELKSFFPSDPTATRNYDLGIF